ncbi:MAG: hypothetical protein HY343_00825 [Lentisphaerae bacterium]|nr:hypothetical protein [Lentisphaerota bacterium]
MFLLGAVFREAVALEHHRRGGVGLDMIYVPTFVLIYSSLLAVIVASISMREKRRKGSLYIPDTGVALFRNPWFVWPLRVVVLIPFVLWPILFAVGYFQRDPPLKPEIEGRSLWELCNSLPWVSPRTPGEVESIQTLLKHKDEILPELKKWARRDESLAEHVYFLSMNEFQASRKTSTAYGTEALAYRGCAANALGWMGRSDPIVQAELERIASNPDYFGYERSIAKHWLARPATYSSEGLKERYDLARAGGTNEVSPSILSGRFYRLRSENRNQASEFLCLTLVLLLLVYGLVRGGFRLRLLCGVLLFLAFEIGFCPHLGANINAFYKGSCQSDLRAFGKVIKYYPEVHTNAYPYSFKDMTNELSDPYFFLCPTTGHGILAFEKQLSLKDVDQWSDYVLLSPPGTNGVLAYCPPRNHHYHGGNILFADGSYSWFSMDDFLSKLEHGRREATEKRNYDSMKNWPNDAPWRLRH